MSAGSDFRGRKGRNQMKPVGCTGDSPGFGLAPHLLLPAAEVLV